MFRFVANRIKARGVINMDFRENRFLQDITLISDCEYFTNHNEPGKYWKNVRGKMVQYDCTQEREGETKPYHANLAWNTTRKIKIELNEYWL